MELKNIFSSISNLPVFVHEYGMMIPNVSLQVIRSKVKLSVSLEKMLTKNFNQAKTSYRPSSISI